MSVDQYATCPCGSGKKIKFCKCKESVSELDRVMKMVEGGQVVPALDRLSTILSEHPDAAWALAIRGRLLLDLREYDTLAENADRFIRLQPSNPLALTQRAAAQVFRGDVKSATDSMLEALTESGRDVDAFVLDVSSAVAFLLGRQGVFLTARVYASLAMMAQGYEGSQMSGSLLRQLNSSPTLNQLVKSIPQPIQRPADADWGERYDEAATLLRSNKVLLAEAKFQSLRRTLPDEPAILSGLLTCAIWRGDVAAQSDFLKKLSACESLDFEERVQFRAVSCLVNPEDKDLAAECFRLDADIESAEPVEMAMIADSRFAPLPAEMLAQMRESEDDVPPRAGFQVLDRDRPEVEEGLPPIDQIPEAIAMAFVYGKQTDRSARVEVHDVTTSVLDDVRAQIQKAIGDSVELNQKSSDPLPFLAVVQPQVAMVRFKASAVEADAMQESLTNTRMPLAIANAKLGILGNASLVETADDDSKLLERTVVVRVAEQYDAIISKGDEVLGEVYRLAKIEPLPTLTISDDEIETVANTDLNRIDSKQLNEESCLYLLQRAQQISSTPAIRHFAKRLIEADLPEDQKMAKLLAYSTLVNASSNAKDAIATIDEAKAFAEANELPTANLLLSEVSLRLQAGDGEGFQKAIETLTQRYGNEPEVMAQLQQMLISMGLIRPDGSPRRGPAPGGVAPAGAEPAAGGIWTPDGGGAAPPADPASGGGSKLWVPGMD
ncbi:tetratricopeptide repeat protein [Novipirellula sp. SH528]|uniref:tetratricopeptide repeat protein n=1 Tax=Novipirellula sp. SH528 TaxID=3454466 RepID=UPI003FA01226